VSIDGYWLPVGVLRGYLWDLSVFQTFEVPDSLKKKRRGFLSKEVIDKYQKAFICSYLTQLIKSEMV